MPQMIHYQDDLFSLSVLVKSLDLVLSTETDPDYFAQRVESDIGFLDESLSAFGSLLTQNALLIERADYLKLLQRTVKAFIGVLERLSGSGYPRSAAFTSEAMRLEAVAKGQRMLLTELDELLRSSLAGDNETDLVSQDEMSELLRE